MRSGKEQGECVRPICFSSRETISSIENLPTDIFLEIFDYLEGGKLYQAFTDLNARFERLLDVSNLRMKTNWSFKEVRLREDYLKDLIVPNKHRILSLELCYPWSSKFVYSRPFIDTSFIRLESLQLYHITETNFIALLVVLANLPRLTSLYLCVHDDLTNITDAYQQIFTFPSIRFLQLLTDSSLGPISLPMAMTEQFTRIESLGVEHECSVDDLLTLLSYTPRLRRLTCSFIIESEVVKARDSWAAIPSLRHVCIYRWEADFHAFETFTTKTAPALKSLYISCYKSADLLNAEQWERVLSQHLPHLSRLDFVYEESINDEFVVTQHHEHIHGFSSPFWAKKRWRFNILIDVDDGGESIVHYTIYSNQ